ISQEEVSIAEKRGIYLEISTRKGHSLTNGWVAKLAEETGAKLILNSDAHSPDDFISTEQARKTLQGAGLSLKAREKVIRNSEELLKERNI
ncbi:unnamed protein product, partial [marine sediment metagenome]